MFVALYGELVLHTWRDPVAATSDEYSLFYARSSAMGWLAPATAYVPGGIWGMNDAGQDSEPGPYGPHRVWFQVSMITPIPTDRPLPVQPFLACAGDVVARMGTFRLNAVQMLLPLQGVHKSAGVSPQYDRVITVIGDANWFDDSDPYLRTNVRVTVDSGQIPSIRLAAPNMFQSMQELKQNIFVCNSYSLTDNDMILKPGFVDALWTGPAQHRATFHGTLVEWSLDALGWLAAFLTSVSSEHGINTPLVFTASRSEGSASLTK
jgi:hypothetical protein